MARLGPSASPNLMRTKPPAFTWSKGLQAPAASWTLSHYPQVATLLTKTILLLANVPACPRLKRLLAVLKKRQSSATAVSRAVKTAKLVGNILSGGEST